MAKLTRKEAASLVSEWLEERISVDRLRKNERRWGLNKARCDLNSRFARYDKEKVKKALEERGLL